MGRTWPAQTALVTMHLQPFVDAWEAEVDFVHDEGLPFGLLGYEGFLNRWAVSFNGYHGYFVVAPVDLFHDRQPSDLLDRLRSRWPGIYTAGIPPNMRWAVGNAGSSPGAASSAA